MFGSDHPGRERGIGEISGGGGGEEGREGKQNLGEGEEECGGEGVGGSVRVAGWGGGLRRGCTEGAFVVGGSEVRVHR